MSWKKILVGLVFVDFAAYTAWVIATQDNAALLAETLANPWSLQITMDLCFAAIFGSVWLYRHAKARGVNPWPWLVAVVPTGSLALLAYATFHAFEAPAPRELPHAPRSAVA